MIEKSTYDFLRKLNKNNDREWFNKHKDEYVIAHENAIAFADDLLALLQKHDNIDTASGKKSLHRIYRDIRFSKDKTPYSPRFSGSFRRATKYLRGGYYFHLEPGNTFIAGGFWAPEPADLQRMREGIVADEKEFRKILKSATFKKNFGELFGEELSRAPKGYPNDHPALDLIKLKQFLVSRPFTDKEAFTSNFVKEADKTFKAMRPLFDFMSEVLTTDANGEPLF